MENLGKVVIKFKIVSDSNLLTMRILEQPEVGFGLVKIGGRKFRSVGSYSCPEIRLDGGKILFLLGDVRDRVMSKKLVKTLLEAKALEGDILDAVTLWASGGDLPTIHVEVEEELNGAIYTIYKK